MNYRSGAVNIGNVFSHITLENGQPRSQGLSLLPPQSERREGGQERETLGTRLENGVGDFPDVAWFFIYTLLKFDVFNADVSFYKRGCNFETKAKSKKARHGFSKEVS